MTIQLDIDFEAFEEWLTPERFVFAMIQGGYDVELKDEFKRQVNDGDFNGTHYELSSGER